MSLDVEAAALLGRLVAALAVARESVKRLEAAVRELNVLREKLVDVAVKEVGNV